MTVTAAVTVTTAVAVAVAVAILRSGELLALALLSKYVCENDAFALFVLT